MGVSKDDMYRDKYDSTQINVRSPRQFGDYANAVAMRELGLRQDTTNTLNMTSALQDIATRTGMAGTINPSDIPSVAGLANQQASIKSSSINRAGRTDAIVDSLPGYVTSYRNYLRWRYPSRYGIKKAKTGSSPNYTTDFQQSGSDIPDLGNPDPYEPKVIKP
jgi:hypothetical protein